MSLALNSSGVPTWHGDPLPLPPKERAVLTLLIRAESRVISKQEIVDSAWGGAAVGDASLVRCVSQIRRVLPEVRIESVYGQGYRLRPATPRQHGRALAAALGPPSAVESFQHALVLSQRHTPRSMARALQVLRAVAAEYPDYLPPRIALARVIGVAIAWGMGEGLQLSVDEGFALLDAAQAMAPEAPGLRSARAWLLDLAWRFDEAEPLYEQALASRGDDAETLQLHAWHLLVTGRPEPALRALQRVLAMRPFAAYTRVMIARCLLAAGQTQDALREAALAQEEHPDDPVVASFHVAVNAWAAPQPALVHRALALAGLPDAPPYARGVLPYVLARCGRPDAARAAIDAVLGDDGEATGAAATAGAGLLVVPALEALGELERAAALLEEGVRARCGLLPLGLRVAVDAALHAHPRVARVRETVFANAG